MNLFNIFGGINKDVYNGQVRSMPLSEKIKVRYFVSYGCWLCLFTFYAFRSNISISILSMAPQPIENRLNSILLSNSSKNSPESQKEYPFSWTQHQQGLVLSSFFFGYLFTNFAGGVLSCRFGARNVMIFCLSGSTLFTFGMVPLAHLGVYPFIAGRVIIGIFSGPLYSIMHGLIGAYAMPNERTIFSSITHSGNIIGLSFNFGVGGFIVDNFKNGWAYFFYMNGILGVVTLIIWCIFVYSSPSEHPLMSHFEKNLINTSLNSSERKKSESFKEIPFKKILLSPAVLLVSLANFANNCILFGQLTGFPKFLNIAYGVTKSTACYLSIIPFFLNFLSQSIYPLIFNYNRASKYMGITSYRKISSAIAFFGASAFLVPIGFLPSGSIHLAIILVSLSMIFLATNQSGFFTAMIDLSPHYAGIIMGTATTLGALSGVIVPQVTTLLVKALGKSEGYKYAFLVIAGMSVLLGLPFIVFGSSENQKFEKNEKTQDVILDNLALIEKADE